MSISKFILFTLLLIPNTMFAETEKSINLGIDFCIEDQWISCEERDKLSRKFEGVAISFGAIASINGICPEPFLTKATAAIFVAGGGIATIAKFYVDGLECEENKTLSLEEKRNIAIMMCFSLGKDYIEELGEFGGCSE